MKFKSVKDVAGWRLCAGCGACAYACPEGRVSLRDIEDDGIRPVVAEGDCDGCDDCLRACPGVGYSMPSTDAQTSDWGPVLDVWEGYSTDDRLRRSGSSGGLATALAMYSVEQEKLHGVLHVEADAEKAWKNITCMSRTREDLLKRTGSRYSPASPCDRLGMMENAPFPSVFIGKPCDVAGLRKAQAIRPALDEKVGVAISIFCAGTPSTKGTLELLKALGLDASCVDELRYRGRGWPGMFSVRLKGGKDPHSSMTYGESWGFLQKFRPLRCHLCPDGSGVTADISCGDPWYREPAQGEPGSSLVIVRTEKGRRVVEGAVKAGYIYLERRDPGIIDASQRNLLNKKRAVWGRTFAMRFLMIPAPAYHGMRLFGGWLKLAPKEMARSVFGTFKRIYRRGYNRKLD